MKKEKGFFGRLRLMVSPQYVFPSPNRGMIWAGLLLAVAAAAVLGADTWLRNAALLTSGPLSSNHALLDDDCDSCHAAGRVRDAKCSACHEKTGVGADTEMPIYSLQAHYVYRSQDLTRRGEPDLEPFCSDCHGEHQGRAAALSQVSNRRCLPCHDLGAFESGHPQFDLIADNASDPAGLKFNHSRHTKVFAERLKLEGEPACLYCHEPDPSGEHFQPLEFDRHCSLACHMNRGTEPLPLYSAEAPGAGVMSLRQLRSRDPFEPCLATVQTGDFASAGSAGLRKARLQHRDCWVIENMKLLRRTLQPGSGWAGLLAVGGAALGREDYLNAVEELGKRAVEMRRSRPESEAGTPFPAVDQMEAELERARRLARRPAIPGRGAQGASQQAAAELDGILSDVYSRLRDAGAVSEDAPVSGSRQAVSRLIGRLTQPCRECHFVSDLGFAPVQTDQRVLWRAEFNHRAHIVQAECLSCHKSVLENEWTGLEAYDERTRRQSEMLNLPGIETCRQCHRSGAATDRCVSCHVFHPDKQRRIERLVIQPRQGEGQ